MNYDFMTNWADKILPVLKTKPIQNAIKRGITKYLRNCDSKQKYDCKELPCHYSRGDSICDLYDKADELITAELIKNGILQTDINVPIEYDEEFEYDEYWQSELAEEYREYKNKIIEPYVTAYIEKQYEAYQCFGACHWYNPTFGLALAKIILPNEKWVVLNGDKHTTVTNKTRTLVFDILYYDSHKADFGGGFAIQEAILCLPAA